ncbi:MAG: smalltalk protein [Prevotella sp.]|nr:smalltalk protein [Prevotella sp.]
MKKESWKTVIQIIISILTAIATTMGVTSCMR